MDYIAVPKAVRVHAAIGASLAEACRAPGSPCRRKRRACPASSEVDLSGTALGYMGRDQAITGEHVQAGDVLMGLPASGIRSNGYSLGASWNTSVLIERRGALRCRGRRTAHRALRDPRR